MPVREITAFKDGHAFVLQEGEMPVDPNGDVVLARLPRPVMGTFWPYAAEENADLIGVVAGRERVEVERTALNLIDLLRANVGTELDITEKSGAEYTARIVSLPERSVAELEETSPASADPVLPTRGELILLQTGTGTRVVGLKDIRHVTFRGEGKSTFKAEELRDLLTLDLAWEGTPQATARVGMAYLQKGFRWIPHYRVSVDGDGQATLRLQATLINELVDLEDVTVHLVIGVPSFDFQDTIDPIALQEQAAALSPYFQQNQQTGFAFSNAMMTQVARMGDYRAPSTPAPIDPGSSDESDHHGARSEDHFLFRVDGVTLGKGERMVVPVVEFTLPYRDVFTLEVPMAPPPELRHHVNNGQNHELSQLFRRPKVKHKVRFDNQSSFPLTTAPALILSEGRLIGQGMMTYTPVGCEGDLELTDAIDVPLDKNEQEVERTGNALKWQGRDFAKIDLTGELELHNRKEEAIELEVVRYVFGEATSSENGGRITRVNLYEDESFAARLRGPRYGWWYYGNSQWYGVNGVSRIDWQHTLAPGESVKLEYGWHYYVR